MITVSNICLNPEFCNNKKRGPCSISLTDWTSQLRNLTTQGNVITGTWWTATGTQRYNNWPLSNPQIVQSYDLSNCQKGPSQTGSLSMVAFHIFTWWCQLYRKGKTSELTDPPLPLIQAKLSVFWTTYVNVDLLNLVKEHPLYCANRNICNRYSPSNLQVYNSIELNGKVSDSWLEEIDVMETH